MKTNLPELDYAYDALEPFMDAETVEIHHTLHHQKYVDNYNEAIKNSVHGGKEMESLFPRASELPEVLMKNGGQAYNHSLFWESLAPDRRVEPQGKLARAIDRDFESFTLFKNRFNTVAAATFGSGWTWLVLHDQHLEIVSTSNHINPMMDLSPKQGKPLFCIDVWEHAYYLKYRNRRPEYLEAMWHVLNWKEVERKYEAYHQ